jgi:hypothetical protein
MRHFGSYLSDTGVQADDLSINFFETTGLFSVGRARRCQLRSQLIQLATKLGNLGWINRWSLRCALK